MSARYTAAHLVLLSTPMRFLILLALAGCPGALDAKESLPGDDGSNLPAPECASAFDCVAAAAKCCDCPTFAVPKTDPGGAACNSVACPMPSMCPDNVAPACVGGKCELACLASTCALSCPDGFVTDAAGCLTCECAQVTQRGCQVASDCARVRADCCGCTRGGEDTAVPVADVAAHDAALACNANPYCPGVDTCAPDLAPECVQGTCELLSGGIPGNACGRPDLPDCPVGTACTINSDAAATAQGVGVCVPPT
jgi:antistasin family protein